MISRRGLKIATLLVLVGGVVALYFSPLRGYVSREHLSDTVHHLRALWYGPIVLIVAYGVGCIFAVPASIFIIAAGIIWGWKLGVTYAMTGAMLGASGEYFLATLLGTLPAHIVFAYCADALFNGTRSEGDAVKKLAVVAGLLISMVALSSLLKRRFARNGVN